MLTILGATDFANGEKASAESVSRVVFAMQDLNDDPFPDTLDDPPDGAITIPDVPKTCVMLCDLPVDHSPTYPSVFPFSPPSDRCL